MEFEFIDESEIVPSRGFGGDKVEKTPSIFDTPLEDRTYWGNDPGSEIIMIFARMQIRKELKLFTLIDIDKDDYCSRLSKEHRKELHIYQLEMLQVFFGEKQYELRQDGYGYYRIVITN